MNFDNLNLTEKKQIWSKLYQLAEYRQKIENDSYSLETRIKEMEKKANTNGSIGCFIIVIFWFILNICAPLIYHVCTSDDKLALLYKENPLQFLIISVGLFCVLSIVLWFIVSKWTGYSEGKRAQKQLIVLKEKAKRYNREKDSVNSSINVICGRYSIPTEVVTLKGLIYIKELVEKKQFEYRAAFSLCLKNLEEVNRLSLAEISEKFPRKKLQQESGLEQLFLFPFKMAGAFLGIDNEVIKREQRRKYGEKELSFQSSNADYGSNKMNASKSHDYTFFDKNGNLCESGGLFYDGKGNPCEWGQGFYDGKGNYVEWGSPFYDGKGNYCVCGQPFYDWQGNLINPKY